MMPEEIIKKLNLKEIDGSKHQMQLPHEKYYIVISDIDEHGFPLKEGRLMVFIKNETHYRTVISDSLLFLDDMFNDYLEKVVIAQLERDTAKSLAS